MNQAEVSRLVSKLRIKVAPRHRNLKNPLGPEGRLLKLRKTVTGLIKHERIELFWNRADESRGYAERLISEAIRHGDCHNATMEMADFWLLDKQVVHKLFKVLVPRFQNCSTSYTRLLRAPMFDKRYACAVLELRGHPYPPLIIDQGVNRQLLHNILLDEAKREYRAKKIAEMSESLQAQNSVVSQEEALSDIPKGVENTLESDASSDSDTEEPDVPQESTSKPNTSSKASE